MIVVFEIVCGIILVSYIRISLSVSNQDATARGSTFYHFLNHTDKYPLRIGDEKFQNPYYFLNQYFKQQSEKEGFSMCLSDLVDYEKPDIRQKIKIVIVSACRPIEKQNKLYMFQLEVLTYHMNLKLFPNLLPVGEKIDFETRCSEESSIEYALIFNDPYYQYDNFKSRNDNYHYRIPFLQEALDDLVTNPTEEPFDSYYLKQIANLSFVKICKFLCLLAEKFENLDKFNKFVKQLVKDNYQFLNHKFLKYTNLLQYTKHTYINTSSFDHIIDKMETMKHVAELFQNHSNLPLIFILEYDRFYDTHMRNHQGIEKGIIQYADNHSPPSLSSIKCQKLNSQAHYLVLDSMNEKLNTIELSYFKKFKQRGTEIDIFEIGLKVLLSFVHNLKELIFYKPDFGKDNFFIRIIYTSLTYLELVDTNFKDLDIKGLVNLTDFIFFNNNEIGKLDLKQNMNLKELN